MNNSVQAIVSAEFLVDAYISQNGRTPHDVDEFEAWIQTIDIEMLMETYYPGWRLATKARDIIDTDKTESAKYAELIFSVAAQAN